MKTLTAFNEIATDNPNANPIYLLKLELTGPGGATLDLYLCDRLFGTNNDCVWQSNIYQPIVLSWGTIALGKINPVTYDLEPSEVDFVIDNTIPIGGYDTFSALFSYYYAQFTTATISLIFSGATAANDEISLFKGQIEDILNMQQDQITVACSGFELDLANKFTHEIVDTTTYTNADPDDVGKMLPVVYGSAKKVPCLAIDVGALTTLSETVSSTAVTLKLTDSTLFPANGTVLIDAEQITYTGNAGNSLTGCTRAANSTRAVKHTIGAKVGEIQLEYCYALGHAVKAIDAVYVDNVKQQAGVYTAYTGQGGSAHGTYGGKAIISFASWPEIKRASIKGDFDVYRESTSVPIGRVKSLDRNGMVLDYDTNTTITFQAAPTGTLTDIYVEYEFEFRNFGTPSGYWPFYLDGTLIACWRDGVFTQFVTSPLRIYKAAWPATATKTKSLRDGGMTGTAFAVLSAKVYATSDTDDRGNRGKHGSIDSSNQPLGRITSETTVEAGTSITFPVAPAGALSDIEITYTWDFRSWGAPVFSGCPWHVTIDGINVAWVNTDGIATALMPSSFTVRKGAWQTTITKTASRLDEFMRGYALVISSARQSYFTDTYSEDIQLTGNSMADAVIGSRVSVDVQGYMDVTGAYGGVNSLIKRPDWILKHILIEKCGLVAGDIDLAGTYTDAGTWYTANAITLAPVMLEKPSVRALFQKIAYQAKSLQFWEAGIHHLVHIPTSETTDKYLDENRIDLNQLWIRYTPRVDIKNSMTARYARDWSGYSDNIEADQAVVTATAAASIIKYGTIQGEQLSLHYITGTTQAQLILNWIIGEWDDPRLIVELSGGYYLTDIERGDIIGFSLGADAGVIFQDRTGVLTWGDTTDIEWHKTLIPGSLFLKKALLYLVTNEIKLRVIDKIHKPDGSQQIQLVEV